MKHPPKLKRSRLPSNARPAQSKPAHATATADDGLDRYPRTAEAVARKLGSAEFQAGVTPNTNTRR